MTIAAVVGPDGAGKSTVTRRVAQVLRDTGTPAVHVDRWDIVDNPAYPATRFMRPDVPDTRLCVAEMPNPTRFLFLMWSIGTALLARNPPLDPHAPVLLDGYWMKHAASEIVYGLDQPWVQAVTAGLPRADTVVYLRLTPRQAWERKAGGDVVPYECGMDPACTWPSFERHQRCILEVLDGWAARDGWTVVDAARPLDTVVAEVTALTAGAPQLESTR